MCVRKPLDIGFLIGWPLVLKIKYKSISRHIQSTSFHSLEEGGMRGGVEEEASLVRVWPNAELRNRSLTSLHVCAEGKCVCVWVGGDWGGGS